METDPAATDPAAPPVPAYWSAKLLPYGVPTLDGRVVEAPADGMPAHRPLPLPLVCMAADADDPGYMPSHVVGRIDGLEIREDDDGGRTLWGWGTLDLEGMPAEALAVLAAAHRLAPYGLHLPIGVDVDNLEFTEPDPGETLRMRGRIMGATINTGAAWHGIALCLTDTRPGFVTEATDPTPPATPRPPMDAEAAA